jgi:hypothetical protein
MILELVYGSYDSGNFGMNHGAVLDFAFAFGLSLAQAKCDGRKRL